MSSELKLYHYSLEACVAAVMRRRVPHISQAVMATWFNAGHAGEQALSAYTPLRLLKGSGWFQKRSIARIIARRVGYWR